MVYYRININHDQSSQINLTNDKYIYIYIYILNNHKNILVNCSFVPFLLIIYLIVFPKIIENFIRKI